MRQTCLLRFGLRKRAVELHQRIVHLLVSVATKVVAGSVTRMDRMQLLHRISHLVSAACVIAKLPDKLHQCHCRRIVAFSKNAIDCLPHLAHGLPRWSSRKGVLVQAIGKRIHKPRGNVLVPGKSNAL